MKSKQEIILRRNALEENLNKIKNECGRICVRHSISQLNWVLDNEKPRRKQTGNSKRKK